MGSVDLVQFADDEGVLLLPRVLFLVGEEGLGGLAVLLEVLEEFDVGGLLGFDGVGGSADLFESFEVCVVVYLAGAFLVGSVGDWASGEGHRGGTVHPKNRFY